MTTPQDMHTDTSVLALVGVQDQDFPLLPIRPLNSIAYTRLLLNVGTTSIYKLIGLGKLDARKLGNQTRITGESIKAFIATLPKGVADSPQPEGKKRRSAALGCAASYAPNSNSTLE
jgi:hypothetical protein